MVIASHRLLGLVAFASLVFEVDSVAVAYPGVAMATVAQTTGMFVPDNWWHWADLTPSNAVMMDGYQLEPHAEALALVRRYPPIYGFEAGLLMVTLMVIGADVREDTVTWDCWKPILRETSSAPSRGRLVADILHDPAVRDVRIENHSVLVRNRWNESWRIDPVLLPWGQVAAHASPHHSAWRSV
eukprot:TRINITY_DN2055_c0_g4_i2.p1 TRINITY_DN2055_c0_g4~~TRINITY_DN2055_c0_g4_i2.p1  ORF type:complete len:207 (+),score=1.63 TRINITY_DN2055_c0_g4_i2:68-622(+)